MVFLFALLFGDEDPNHDEESGVTPLRCAVCNRAHDLDEGPDVGKCLICGGFLIEGAGDRPAGSEEAVEYVKNILTALERRAKVSL